MGLNFSETIRNARLQAVITELDTGDDGVLPTAYMEFYDNPRPSAGAAITTETLIGTVAFSEPSGTISAGVLTFDTITDDLLADADADIGWARAYDSGGVWQMDMGCGLVGSGQEILFNTLTARIGGVIKILSGSFTEGNS